MKKCFVIMPFGKTKEDLEFFSSVYESIILPAAEKNDYETNRVDTKPDNFGNITKNIINDLVFSDIVIADLTASHANVFYELGIRHALHRCSTILIIQDGHEIPFDLKQHVAVFYSTDIRSIQKAIKGISDAIVQSEKATENDADNPVHEYIPSLAYVSSTKNEDTLRKRIKELTNELKNYREISERYGIQIEEEIESDADIERALEEAHELINIGGINAIQKIRDVADSGNIDEFFLLLKEILKSKLLTENNYLELSKFCNNLGLIPHRIVVLKKAHVVFPQSHKMVGLLADAYSDHPQPRQKTIGKEFIEEYMGVKYKNKLPIATEKTLDSDFLIMGLFNLYSSLEDWEAIISFTDSGVKIGLNDNEGILTRNKARALIRREKLDEAEKVLTNAIENSPEDDSLHTILSTLYKEKGDYENALIAQERAVICDKYDADNYFNLAIDVLNKGLVHNESGELIGPIDKKERLNEAIHLFNQGLLVRDTHSYRIRVAEILSKKNAAREANEAITTGRITIQEESLELAYVLSLLEDV